MVLKYYILQPYYDELWYFWRVLQSFARETFSKRSCDYQLQNSIRQGVVKVK